MDERGVRANFSFESVTDTGAFAVSVAPKQRLHLGVHGADTRTRHAERSSSPDGGDADVASYGVKRHPRNQHRLSLHAVDKAHTTSEHFMIDLEDKRVKRLIESMEEVYNRTHQIPRNIHAVSIWPVVLMRVQFRAMTSKGMARVEAVIERRWCGRQRPKYVTLKKSTSPRYDWESSSTEEADLMATPLHKVLTMQIQHDEPPEDDEHIAALKEQVKVGLGRIIASHHRSSASYQVC
jgi:hypothetical protein